MQFLLVRSHSDIPVHVPVLGIEIPGNRGDILARCTLGNIDPQHGGSAASGRCAAEEAALSGAVYPSNTLLVCTRIDLDAVAAMAIIAGLAPTALSSRLAAIGQADSFLAGSWPGPQPLPTPDAPWLTHGTPEDRRDLAGPNWICGLAARGSIPLADAVERIARWLQGEDLPLPHEALTQRIASIDRARHLQTCLNGRVVYHDAIEHGPVGASIAYCLAPVSVLRQRDPRGGFIRYTVAASDAGRFDFAGLVADLTALEVAAAGDVAPADLQSLAWGGNVQTGRIIGSPQGRDSLLTPAQVLECIERRLTF